MASVLSTDMGEDRKSILYKCLEDTIIGQNRESKVIDEVNQFLESSIFLDVSISSSSSQSPASPYGHHSTNEKHSKETERHCSSLIEEKGEKSKCVICHRIFKAKKDLNLHERSRRKKDKRFQCCNCDKVFRDSTQFKVHSRKHTGEKPFECLICNKKFTVNGNLNKHMRIHTGEKRFECPDCGKKFTQLIHLKDHVKTHTGEKPYKCNHCQTGFKTKTRVRRHEKTHLISMRGAHNECPKCDVTLKSKSQMSEHLLAHAANADDDSKIDPFVCHQCNEIFLTDPCLQDHLKRHKKKHSFFCELCNRKFASGTHLTRHLNSHTGFKPYMCDICKRQFPSAQNLKRHMMTHTGEKPFECDECNRRFLTIENLNRHKRTHTGEKPFSCQICGRLFAHSTTAKEHYQTVHSLERPHKCALCQQNFSLSKMLYKHIRIKHPRYFPEFKKERDLTPNMKKTLKNYKENGPDNSNKIIIGNNKVLVFENPMCSVNNKEIKTELVVKEESQEENGSVKCSSEDFTLKTKIKIENCDEDDVNN